MERVYLMGAGTSRELECTFKTQDAARKPIITRLCKHGLLSSGYFYDAHQLDESFGDVLPVASRLVIPEIVARYVCEYYEVTFSSSIVKRDIVNNEKTSRKINIEALYRYVEEEITRLQREDRETEYPHVDDPSVRTISVRYELLKYIHRSLSLICYYCLSRYHRVLAEHIVNHGDNIISFNWDILLDEALRCTDKWNYEDGYGVEFKKVFHKGKKRKRMSMGRRTSKNLMLKPHGSINWYKKVRGNDDLFLFVPVERKYRGGTFGMIEALERDKDKNQYFTSMVPPGLKRKAFPSVWVQVKQVLERAREIIAIGFGFNDNDCHVRREFEDVSFRKDLKIVLVNPKADRIAGTYKNVFRTDHIVNAHNTLRDYCQSIRGG